MKIKTNREIEIPDSLTCYGCRKECSALERIKQDGKPTHSAHCKNFNSIVFWPDNARFYVKCRDCIDASLDYLNGVTK